MVQFSAIGVIMADSVPPEQRGVSFAVSMTIPSAVGILSPYIGGYLIDNYGTAEALRWMYASTMILMMIASTIRFKFLKETIKLDSSKLSFRNIPLIIKDAYKSAFEAIKWVPRRLWFLVSVMILISLSNSIVSPFWVVYAVDIIGLSASQWGLLGLIAAILSSLLGIPAGLMVDRMSKRLIIIVGLASIVLPVYYFIHAKTFWEVLIVTLITSIANAFLNPASQVLMADSVPRELRGRVMSAVGRGAIMVMGPGGGGGGGPGMGLILTIPTILGSLAGGYMYSASPMLPWILLTIIFAISTIISVAFIKEPSSKEL
jgi:MFS family permease